MEGNERYSSGKTQDRSFASTERLQEATPILSKAVRDGKVKVIGGLYDLETGRVNLVV